MAQILLKIIILAMLLICGIQDAMKKKIYLWIVALSGMFICICIPFCGPISIFDKIGGVLVGIFVVIISIATRGKIGLGDGLLICITGLGLGFWGNMELFGLALLLAAVLSIILLIFRLVDRKKSIPFIPFLFLGYLLIVVSEIRIGMK